MKKALSHRQPGPSWADGWTVPGLEELGLGGGLLVGGEVLGGV